MNIHTVHLTTCETRYLLSIYQISSKIKSFSVFRVSPHRVGNILLQKSSDIANDSFDQASEQKVHLKCKIVAVNGTDTFFFHEVNCLISIQCIIARRSLVFIFQTRYYFNLKMRFNRKT